MNACWVFGIPTRRLLKMPDSLESVHPFVRAFGNSIVKGVVEKSYFGLLLFKEEAGFSLVNAMETMRTLQNRAKECLAKAELVKGAAENVFDEDLPLQILGYGYTGSREVAYEQLFLTNPVDFLIAMALANHVERELSLRFIIDLEADEYRYTTIPLNNLLEPTTCRDAHDPEPMIPAINEVVETSNIDFETDYTIEEDPFTKIVSELLGTNQDVLDESIESSNSSSGSELCEEFLNETFL